VFGDQDPGQWSPLRYVNQQSLRTLFVVGTEDLPGCRSSYLAVRDQVGQGSRHWFVELPLDHANTVIWMGTDRDQVTPQIAAFIGASPVGR
jgi:hypothetical protein